jgi:hypothetical protein
LCVEQTTDGGLVHQFLNKGHGLLLLVVSEKHANRTNAKAHVHLQAKVVPDSSYIGLARVSE